MEDDLIAAIQGDIDYAKQKFKELEVAALSTDHPFWAEVSSKQAEEANRSAGGADPPSG